MTESEIKIYNLMFKNSWHCNETHETFRFSSTGSDSFSYVKILNGVVVESYFFDRISYRSANNLDSPNNKILPFFTGINDHYSEVISDQKLKVFLPGIDHLELCKVEN